MARKGKSFELSYEWLYKLNENKYTVTSPAMIYDKTTNSNREVDVLIEYEDNNNLHRRIGIECRDRKKNRRFNVDRTIKYKKRRFRIGLYYCYDH